VPGSDASATLPHGSAASGMSPSTHAAGTAAPVVDADVRPAAAADTTHAPHTTQDAGSAHTTTDGPASGAAEGPATEATPSGGENASGATDGDLDGADGGDPVDPANGGGHGGGPDRSSDQIIRDFADEHGLSNQDLHDLRHTPASQLSQDQRAQLLELRSLIDAPTPDTHLVKVIPFDDVSRYQYGEYGPQVGGFVARASDLNPWGGLDQVVADARLDYTPNSGQTNPYTVPGADSYGFIEFQTQDVDLLGVPFSPEFGGTAEYDQPFAGSGFLLNRDDVWRPEYEASARMDLSEGARLWAVGPDGPRLVGIYIPGRGFFAPGSGS